MLNKKEGKSQDVQIAFTQYKKSYIRYMIMDILVVHQIANTQVGLINKMLDYINSSVDIPDMTTLGEVKHEISYLQKLRFVEYVSEDNIRLSDEGIAATRLLLFESLANTCLSNYTSLKISHESHETSKRALSVARVALAVALLIPLLIKAIELIMCYL